MSMYLRAAKTEAEDAGISTEGMAESVSQLRNELKALTGGRVDIMSDAEAGSYKSTVEILRELSDVWDDLSDTSRTNITELIGGGVRNANIISALMNNFSIVEDAVATSMESSGSALAENEKHLDSIAGKTQKFNAAFETMAYTMVDNDMIKGVIDAGTMLLNGATWIGDNLGGAIALFTGGRIIDTLSSLDKVLDKNSNLFKFFQSAKSAGSDFKDMFRAIKLGVSDFKEMAKNADGMRGVFEALSKTGGNIWGNLSKGMQFATAGLGIGALISAVSWANEYREKQILLAQESAESYTDSAKAIKDYKEESLDLIRSLDAGILSDEEQFKAKTRLNEIEQELVATYGAQADQLDLLSKSARDAETSFDSFAAAKANEYLRENRGSIEDATSAMTQYRANTLGVFDWSEMSADAQSAVQKIVDSFDNVSLIDSAFGKKTLTIAGDNAQEMLDIIDQVNAKISSSGKYVNDHFNSNINGATDVLRETVDTYGSQYNAEIEAAIAASSDYTGIMKDIDKAESEYTKTMSASYDSIADRAKAMSEVQEVVNATVQDYQDARASIVADDPGVADFFDEEIANLEEYQNILNFGADLSPSSNPSEKINDVSDALNRLRNESGELDADYINKFSAAIDGKAVEDLEGQERAYWDLTEALSAYELEVADAIPVLKAFGIIRKSVGDLMGEAETAYTQTIAEQQAVANAYASQSAGHSVSIDTYKSLIALSDEYTSCLEYQNGSLQLNKQKLTELSKARAQESLLAVNVNKLEAQKQYSENAKAIDRYRNEILKTNKAKKDEIKLYEDEIKALEARNKEIEKDIAEYGLMAKSIEESMSAYTEWAKAQSEAQAGSWHAAAASGLDEIKKIYQRKEYGNTSLQEGLEFLTGANITGQKDYASRISAIDSAYKQLSATISGTSYSLNSFMQSGKAGANNFLRAVSQLNGEWASFDYATQQWTLNYDNAELAKSLGTTEEFVVMMNNLLELYGFEFEPKQLLTEDESVKKATDLVEQYKEAVKEVDDLTLKGVSGPEMDAAQDNVSDIITKLASMPKEALISVGFDLTDVKDEDIATAIQEQLGSLELPSSNINVGDTPVTAPEITGVAHYTLGDHPTEAPTIYGSAVYTVELNGVPRGSTYLGGTGGAQVGGTAKFNGDIGTAPGGRTLVGELGREMYVDPSTNTWHTIGDNGAEFVNLPRNAIVFNHMQTASLLSKGRISARGRALVSGNAAVMVSPELDGGYDYTPPTATGGVPGGVPQTTKKKKKKKKKEKSFEDLYKKHNHLREMDKETDEEYLDWLEDAYKEAYEKGEISLDDYRKYAEEVYELQKELFQDSLNDMEHEISILERESGNESQIISMYKDMMSKIQKEIKAAKKRGLDDDSDYIQDLLDQYYEYADAIEEIQDEITDGATSAVEDLVNYKIQMIKQDLENEKDALNEKLDDLKDFYDKQKKMLRDARDEEKYLDEQSEKRKGVSDIQAEIDQLSMNNSAWAQKRKLELQEELVKAQKELDEFEKDHALDTTEDFLDKMYEQQEAQIESQISAIDEKLNDPNALYNQALAAIQNNTAELYKEMVDYNNKYGDGNPETVSKMWDEAYESLNAYLELFGEAYKDIVLVGNSSSVSGYASGTRRATPGPHKVFENGDEYIFQASDGTRYKMFSGGEKVLNAKATNFLYDFATSGGKILASMLPGIMGGGALSKISRPSQPIQLSTGNIIIEGNANERTVSEIRRAQREGIDYILKEFTRLNK